MQESLIPVTPVQPVAPWIGGKRNLARRICSILDQWPCATYAEPFVGMGGVFLRRSTRPRAEVINDVAEVRDLFGWGRIEAVQTTYTVAAKPAAHPAKELLIRGTRD